MWNSDLFALIFGSVLLKIATNFGLSFPTKHNLFIAKKIGIRSVYIRTLKVSYKFKKNAFHLGLFSRPHVLKVFPYVFHGENQVLIYFAEWKTSKNFQEVRKINFRMCNTF